MTYGRFLAAAAATMLVTGCNWRADQEYYNALPTAEGLSLELAGTASEGIEKPGVTRSGVESSDEFVMGVRSGVRSVNASVHYVLDTVHAIVENNEGEEGPRRNTRVYGPFDRGNVTYKLTVAKFTRVAFGFKLEAKPLGGDDSAYLVIFGGAVARGEEPHMGRGAVGINLDNAAIVDPSFPGTGALLAGFGHRPEGKALAFAARNYTPDPAEHDAITAAFVGWKRADNNATAIRLGTKADMTFVENNTATKENVGIRARWIPGTGGRAAGVVFGGDVPENTLYVGLACWDAQEQEQFKSIVKCTIDPSTGARDCSTIVLARGNRDACSISRDLEEPPTDLNDGRMEDEAPVSDAITPPADVPSGDREL